MNEKFHFPIVLISESSDGHDLVIAEDGIGDLFWCKTDSGIYMPGEAIAPEDTYPISTLPAEIRNNVLQQIQGSKEG